MKILQPKRKVFADFWDSLEAQCKVAGLMTSMVPASIKKLLTAAGYNSAWSFKTVTEEKLSEAEDFIEKHHRLEADGFEEYKDIKPFKFLPGHKSLIFGIKTEIDEYQDMKKPKISKKSIPVLSENDLQMSLLSQMSTFSKKLGLHADWSNSIENSSYSASETASFCTCTVSCPICSAESIVRYDKHWKNSNLCKHVRKHVEPKMHATADIVANGNANVPNRKRVKKTMTDAASSLEYQEIYVEDSDFNLGLYSTDIDNSEIIEEIYDQ